MFNTLGAGHLGIHGLSLEELVKLASSTGFEGLAFDLGEARDYADAHGLDGLTSLFSDNGVRPADFTIPVNWRGDRKTFETDLAALPPFLEIAQALDTDSTNTWIMPADDEMDYDQQLQWYIQRLGPLSETLNEYGIRFGMEFIGPKTLRDQFSKPFVYKMKDMLDVARQIGPNVGILFDTYHFWTGRNDMDEIDALRPEQVVLVHTNDAPAGIDIDEQMDTVRTLPMETGEVPAPEMLRRLAAIGYQGPVETEPFSQPLRDIAAEDPAAAAKRAYDAQIALLTAAGLR